MFKLNPELSKAPDYIYKWQFVNVFHSTIIGDSVTIELPCGKWSTANVNELRKIPNVK